MSLEIKYTKMSDVDNENNVLVRIDKIKALESKELPDEYLFGKCPRRKVIQTYCAWIPMEDVLVVHSKENGFMGHVTGDGNIAGYRVGDIIDESEFNTLVDVLKVCGNRLHDIKLARRGKGKVLSHGVVKI